MTDSEIIWRFLDREFLNDHPAIFLYCCGNVRNPNTAMDKIMEITRLVFSPVIEEYIMIAVAKAFLENKKRLYMKGIISVKSNIG